MILTIAIPTIVGREYVFGALLDTLYFHIHRNEAQDKVEIISFKDNKEMSIGAKRQKLLDMAVGDYIFMVDDDDYLPAYFIPEVLAALQDPDIDCIGYLEECMMNGQRRIACHSNRFEDWADNKEGYDYVRTIFYKDVIRTSIARQISFENIRYGEDNAFAKKLKASGLLKKEAFIDKIMYHYKFNTLTPEQHKERYGLK